MRRSATFGNHEFDIGIDALLERMRESKFVWLGTNVIDVHTGIPLGNAKSSMMFELDGIKIGLIGLTTTETTGLSTVPRGIIFAPAILSAQAAIHNLKKQGVDIVIAVTHLGLSEDIQLVRAVPEINLVLGGHDHEAVAYFEGNTLIYKSGCDGKFLGRIDLDIEQYCTQNKPKTVVFAKHTLIPNHGYGIDPEAQELLKSFQEMIDVWKSVRLGLVQEPFETLSVRKKESPFANLVADSMQKIYHADMAMINSGAVRGFREYPAGYAISRIDIQQELPFDNIVVLVEMLGEDLLEAIEFAKRNIEERGGGFLQFSSDVKVVYDPTAPKMHRLRGVSLHSKGIDKTAVYRVAIPDYLMKGGDENHWFTRGKALIHTGTGYPLIDVVCDYIKQIEILRMVPEGRIVEAETNVVLPIQTVNGKRIILHESIQGRN
jgi:5'-nucleotidase / UDP-sugar diphosphatase